MNRNPWKELQYKYNIQLQKIGKQANKFNFELCGL